MTLSAPSDWTGIKFLRRPPQQSSRLQHLLICSHGLSLLTHITSDLHQYHQDMWLIPWLKTLTICHDPHNHHDTYAIIWSSYCAMGSSPFTKAHLQEVVQTLPFSEKLLSMGNQYPIGRTHWKVYELPGWLAPPQRLCWSHCRWGKRTKYFLSQNTERDIPAGGGKELRDKRPPCRYIYQDSVRKYYQIRQFTK